MTCKETSQLISKQLDQNLPIIKKCGLILHLFFCNACSRYEKQMIIIKELTKSYLLKEKDTAKSKITLSNDAKERLKEVLKKTDNP